MQNTHGIHDTQHGYCSRSSRLCVTNCLRATVCVLAACAKSLAVHAVRPFSLSVAVLADYSVEDWMRRKHDRSLTRSSKCTFAQTSPLRRCSPAPRRRHKHKQVKELGREDVLAHHVAGLSGEQGSAPPAAHISTPPWSPGPLRKSRSPPPYLVLVASHSH